jgi:hypothetical protein
MTRLEDQLRLAFRAKASQITPPPPPLELQPRPVFDPAAHRGSGRAGTPLQRRWLVPLAAAAAVIAVIAGALVVTDAVAPQRKPPAAPIQTNVPPYYVSLNSVRPMPPHEPQWWPVRTTATVRATSTGAVIARIDPPQPYTEFINVSGAPDDRHFVLAAQYGSIVGPDQDGFFLLSINPTAASPAARASLTPLPAAALPRDDILDAMALSPDGRLLATVAMGDRDEGEVPSYLRVYNLVTGRARTWSGISFYGDTLENPGNGGLSWLPDGRFLAVPSSLGHLRLLNVNAQGHSLARDSKPFADLGWPCANWCFTDTTPDGKTVFVEYTTLGRGLGRQRLWANLARFNVPTGTRTRVNRLNIEGHGGRDTGYDSSLVGPDGVLWTNYSGSRVIVTDVLPGVLNAGIYDGSRYTPIPWPANIEYATW